MLPAKTILHPTDFSDGSRYAFRVASTLARDEGARLLVLYVNPTVGPQLPYGEVLGQLQLREYKDWLRKILNRFQVPNCGVKVEHHLVDGEPSREILRLAEEAGCDLIVMGTHRRMGLEHVILGSVADQVLRNSRCPVVLVKLPPHYHLVVPAAEPTAAHLPAVTAGAPSEP